MAAAATDKFTKVGNPGTATTLAAPGHSIAGTTFNVVSTSNWPTTTGVVFAVDNYTLQTVNGVPNTPVRTPGTYTEWEGVVASGTQITGGVLRYGTDQNYSAGSLTRVYIPVASQWVSQMVDGILVQHNQDGTHGAITSTALTNVGAFAQTGATTLNGSWDGWVGANESWAFASSTTITVPTDATTKYDIGDYIKITQSATVKYFVITSLTSTVLTVAGLAGVTVANSAITANAYSKARNPFGNGLKGGAPYNPYKFRASMNGAANTGNGAFALIPLDTEQYDTGNNHSAGVFTAPVAGFYQFNWNSVFTLSAGADETGMASIFKNGTEVSRGSEISYRNIQGSHGSDLIQLAASDTVDMRVFAATTRALQVGTIYSNFLSGYFVSAL